MASPFDERVKRCMNHIRDFLVGTFLHVGLSADLTKSLLSVFRTPSLFSKSLAAFDLYQLSLSPKFLLRLCIGILRSRRVLGIK